MTTSEITISLIGTGTGILLFILGKLIGKKKEDIEIALKYQEFYQKHIKDLKDEIGALAKKVNILIDQDNEKSLKIEEQHKNLKKWESYCERLEVVHKEDKKLISKLFTELESHK